MKNNKWRKGTLSLLGGVLLAGLLVSCAPSVVEPAPTDPTQPGTPTVPTVPTDPIENTVTEAQLEALRSSQFYADALEEFPEVETVDGYTEEEVRAALYTSLTYLNAAFGESTANNFLYNGQWREGGYSTEYITALFGPMYTPAHTDRVIDSILEYVEMPTWSEKIKAPLNHLFGFFDIAMMQGEYLPSEQCITGEASCVLEVEFDTNWQYWGRNDIGDLVIKAPNLVIKVAYYSPTGGEFSYERYITNHELHLVRYNTGWEKLDTEGTFPFLINGQTNYIETDARND